MRIGPELLQDLLDRVEGSLAAAIGTADGLLVEGVRKRPLDLEAAIAEHAALWRQARAAYARSLGAEEVGELLVGGTGVVGYLRSMRTRDPEPLFLLLLLVALLASNTSLFPRLARAAPACPGLTQRAS